MKKLNSLFFALLFLCVLPKNFVFADTVSETKAPDFTLTDTNAQPQALSAYQGKFVVLEWNNPDCPFVKKHYSSGNMQNLQKSFTEKGVIWLTVTSSAPGKQGNYSAEARNEMAEKDGSHATAILLDTDGKVGKLYSAQTTPHMFVINPD